VLHWRAAIEGPAATAIRLHRKLLTPVAAQPQRQGVLTPPTEQVDQNLLVEVNGPEPNGTIDKDIRFGAAYEYRAQRVIRVEENGTTMELDGPFSTPVRVDALDVFPPAIPAGLAAVSVPAENGHAPAIDLDWQPNTETDLAGYVVYRREKGGAWQRISPAQAVLKLSFHDAHVEAGHTYEYAVSAVDQGGHESGRSETAAETVPEP
jgi:fibronectin type 3 domain-containing protein